MGNKPQDEAIARAIAVIKALGANEVVLAVDEDWWKVMCSWPDGRTCTGQGPTRIGALLNAQRAASAVSKQTPA